MISFPTVQSPVMQGMMQGQDLMKSIMSNLATGQTFDSTVNATNAQNNAVSQTAVPSALAGLTTAQSQANYSAPMDQAKLGLIRAQTQNQLAPSDTPYQRFSEFYDAWNKAPQGSPLKIGLGQALDSLTAGKGGLSVTQSPGGGLSVTQGMALPSQAPSGSSFVSQSQAQPAQGQAPQVGADGRPMEPGNGSFLMAPTGLGTNSRFSGGGAVYGDQSGNKLITDDRPQQARDQKQLAAIQRAVPQLQQLIGVANQTQGAVPAAESKVGGWINGLTQNTPLATNFQLPSLQADKEARASNIAESLINTFGVNATNHAIDMFKQNAIPQPGESTQGYAQRQLGQIADFLQISDQNKARLVNGTTIDKDGHLILPNWVTTGSDNSGSAPTAPADNDIQAEIARRKQAGTWK